MKVSELIELLSQQDPDTVVYVDFDREGGNEEPVDRAEPIDRPYIRQPAIVLR